LAAYYLVEFNVFNVRCFPTVYFFGLFMINYDTQLQKILHLHFRLDN